MNEKRGSTLVLLVIVIALVMVLGAAVLNVVITQYEIKRFNTVNKKSFYMSETGLNEAYVSTCVLIDESIIKALQLAEDYIAVNPLNETEAKNMFITNYMINIKSNIKNRIETTTNPSVEIRSSTLNFVNNVLKVLVRSSYTNEDNVAKYTWVELNLGVPEFEDVRDGVYDIKKYIKFVNWDS